MSLNERREAAQLQVDSSVCDHGDGELRTGMLTRPEPSRPRPELSRPRLKPSKIGLETGLVTLTKHHKLIAEWTAKTKVKIRK